MQIFLGAAVMPALLQRISLLIDGGSQGPGVMELYDRPEEGGTLLASVTLKKPSAIKIEEFSATFAFSGAANALARGSAAWAKFKDSDGMLVFECDAGGQNGSAALTLDDPSIRLGDSLKLEHFTLRLRQVSS